MAELRPDDWVRIIAPGPYQGQEHPIYVMASGARKNIGIMCKNGSVSILAWFEAMEVSHIPDPAPAEEG